MSLSLYPRLSRSLIAIPPLAPQAFEAWIRALPDAHSPAWLGLPVQAASQLKSMIGQKALSKLAQLQGVESANEVSSADTNTHQIRLRSALEGANRWIKTLPSEGDMASLVASSQLESDSQASLSSLQRCLMREVIRGRSALALVRKDLERIKYVSLTPSATIKSYYLILIFFSFFFR